jgi:LmbE family N-acetylglucosaminyl deacetylase
VSAPTVLVVAAHPDDEVLGCAATAALRVSRGEAVHIAILGTGLTARTSGGAVDVSALAALREDARAVGGMLGAKSVSFADLPDNRFDTLALLDVVKQVERWLGEIAPAVVYTHHPGDLNVDHRLTFQAVLTATRPLPGAGVRDLYAFEVPSATDWAFQRLEPAFRPSVFEDVTDTIEVKLACMARYAGEARAFPHPRSAEALRATARRWGSVAGMAYAEAFELIRSLRT